LSCFEIFFLIACRSTSKTDQDNGFSKNLKNLQNAAKNDDLVAEGQRKSYRKSTSLPNEQDPPKLSRSFVQVIHLFSEPKCSFLSQCRIEKVSMQNQDQHFFVGHGEEKKKASTIDY
jgi:hypothetical protein